MIAGKEMKMAKVELNGVGGTFPDGGSDQVSSSSIEYADKTWDEYVTFNIIEELLGKRKTIQRKLDAARKRMKRLTVRLNTLEKQWAVA